MCAPFVLGQVNPYFTSRVWLKRTRNNIFQSLCEIFHGLTQESTHDARYSFSKARLYSVDKSVV